MIFSREVRTGLRKALSVTICATLAAPLMAVDSQARRAYSSVNTRQSVAVKPYAGGKKAGPIFNWGELVKIESDQALKEGILKKAAEGKLEEIFTLGCMYLYGKGIEKSPLKAFEQFRYAAEKGNSEAQNNLGYMFEEGIGVKKDPKQALSWYHASAKASNSHGLCNLGYMYEHGVGVEANSEEAISLYEKARDAGNKIARQNLLMLDFMKSRKKAKIAKVEKPTQPQVKDSKPKEVAKAENTVKPVTTSETTVVKTSETTVVKTPDSKPLEIAQTPDNSEEKSKPQTVAEKPKDNLEAIFARLSEDTEKAKLEEKEKTKQLEIAEAKEETEPVAKAEPKAEVAKVQDEVKPVVEIAKVQEEVKPQADTAEKTDAAAEIAEVQEEVKPQVEPAEKTDAAAEIAEVQEEEVKPVAEIAKVKEEKKPQAEPVKETQAVEVAKVSDTAPVEIEEKVVEAAEEIKMVAQVPKTDVTEPTVIEGKIDKTQMVRESRPIRDKWALVVGITDFQNENVPNLQYSAKDATDFYNYLIKEAHFKPDHVRLLLNKKATQRRVMSELGSKFLARVVKPDDLVVLYFSTHGSPAELDPRGRNYIVAHDSDPSDLFATGIEMQKLLDSIQMRMDSDRVLLVLDACHSGFADPDSKGIARTANFNLNAIAQGSGQLVICSSGPEQRSWESTRYQNGVFTKSLLEGLRSSGDNTKLFDAFEIAKGKVTTEVQEDRPGAKQTPALKGSWTGKDLVLAALPAAPQTVPTSVAADIGQDSRADLLAMSFQPVKEKAPLTTGVFNKQTAVKKSGDVLDADYFAVRGNPRALVKEYHDAIRANPSDSKYYFLKAKALMALKDWHNAMLCLNDAIQLSPNRAKYYLGRAYVYACQGKRVMADQELAEASMYDPRYKNMRLPYPKGIGIAARNK